MYSVSNTAVQVKKPRKRSPFQTACDEIFSKRISINDDTMSSFLNQWVGAGKHERVKYPLFLKNGRLGTNKQMASARLAKSAYNNGHYDTEMWQYVNPHVQRVIKNQYGQIRTVIESSGFAKYFVIDWDYSNFSSGEEVYDFVEQKGLPSPSLVVQTGPVSFHILFHMAVDETPEKGISHIEVLMFCALLAGLQPNENGDMVGYHQRKPIEELGIDYNYAITKPIYHKMRVPGVMKMKDGDIFQCKMFWRPKKAELSQSWLWSRLEDTNEVKGFRKNKNNTLNLTQLFKPKDEQIWDVSDIDVSVIQSPLKPKPTTDELISELNKREEEQLRTSATQTVVTHHQPINEYWKEYEGVFVDQLSGLLPRRYVKLYAQWLCSNLTFLKRGQLHISQLYLSSVLGIAQTTISKHLKILVNAGILQMTEDYIKAKIPRKYGLGEVLSSLIVKKDEYESLADEYSSGTTNEQMLSDIRILVHSGVEDEEIVEFVSEKMHHRPRRKQRCRREISAAVSSWRSKTTRKIPNQAVIDLSQYQMGVTSANSRWSY